MGRARDIHTIGVMSHKCRGRERGGGGKGGGKDYITTAA